MLHLKYDHQQEDKKLANAEKNSIQTTSMYSMCGTIPRKIKNSTRSFDNLAHAVRKYFIEGPKSCHGAVVGEELNSHFPMSLSGIHATHVPLMSNGTKFC
jgi:hypothetical protein